MLSKKSIGAVFLAMTVMTSGCTEVGNLLAPLWGGKPTLAELPMAGSSAVELKQIHSEVGDIDTVQDLKVVSAEYLVTLTQPVAGDTAIVRIPIERSQLPENFVDAQFQPEVYDNQTRAWKPIGDFVWFDKDSSQAVFRTQFNLIYPPTPDGMKVAQASGAEPLQFRIRIYLFSNQVTSLREGSHFRIHYYPSKLANNSRVPSDQDWVDGRSSVSTEVPDFIEDLDLALNNAYDKLLKINSSKGSLFESLSVQDVYVCDIGGNAGDSKLGGPLRISNSQNKSLTDLKFTAAHELVHVLQGQFYTMQGLFTGRYNHWFIEATANYFAARVNGLDEAGKKAAYGEFFSDYLSVPLSSNLDNSMYAAGHFLDWLSTRYGETVVGDALKQSSGNDTVGLSKAIKAAGGEDASLSTAYEDYLKEILTLPEKMDGFHGAIRDAMANHALGNGFLSAGFITDKRTWLTLDKSLGNYAAVLSSIKFNNSDDALLVVETDGSSGALLKNMTYPLRSSSNAAYASSSQLDQYESATSSKFWKLPHIGAQQKTNEIEQMLFNSSAASAASARVKFYILRPPVITEQSDKELSWDLSTLGNIPKEQIKGFKIYSVDAQDNRQEVLPIQALQSGQTTQSIKYDTNPFAEDEALVTVIDKWDNEWPASEEPTGQAYQCSVEYKVGTYETDLGSGSREICTGNCLLYQGGISDLFLGAFQGELYRADKMESFTRWHQFFKGYRNELTFKQVEKGQSIDGLSMRLEPTDPEHPNLLETLTVDGKLPRVSTSPLKYQISGDHVCGQVNYMSYQRHQAIVCDASSYVSVTCKAPGTMP